MRFDEHFVTGALSNVSIVHTNFPRDVHFSIDSRTLKQGDIFIALPGDRVDGHTFLHDAFAAGAAGCIISTEKRDLLTSIDPQLLCTKLVIVVPDTLHALYKLATAWRSQFTYPVVGITGSVGKTSTKELLAHMLERDGRSVVSSFANQNTKIGLS